MPSSFGGRDRPEILSLRLRLPNPGPQCISRNFWVKCEKMAAKTPHPYLRPGPDLQKEEDAFALAQKRASDYGICLLEMTREAMMATRREEYESLLKDTPARS